MGGQSDLPAQVFVLAREGGVILVKMIFVKKNAVRASFWKVDIFY